ncbi:hypothetical protein GCK32_011354, partial [Trichostrongylus colubriformis]
MLFLALAGLLLHGGGAQHICAWSSPMNDVDRGLFLDILNTYRAYVARGEAYQLNGKLSGSNELFELKYDCQLELMAHMNTYSCNQTFHPPATSINYFMFVNEPHAWSKRDLIPMAASSWYQPVLDFWNKSDPRLESFVNMMYYESMKVGCSHNLCPSTATTPSTNAIACVYNSAPQKNDVIYVPGRYGCINDDDCSKNGTPFRCIKYGSYRGLCSQDTTDAPKSTILPLPETTHESYWTTGAHNTTQKEKLRGQPKTSTQLRSAQKAELRGQPKNSTQ